MDKILELTEQMTYNFINYAMAVNTDRSIPDAKTGLKPVHQRILFGAEEMGMNSNKPFVKSAKLVGMVLSLLHPHGDSSVYEAAARLSQPWVMRYPLIQGHGNFGNINGDGPAASRYTEMRLAPLSEKGLLCGLNKRNTEMKPNYDNSAEEPISLPALFPNLLCNPNEGIGVGLACKFGSYNLREIFEAISMYVKGAEPVVSGPDFPTGGIIVNGDDIPKILKTGKGTVRIRGRHHIEKNQIVFTEIPYGVKVDDMLEGVVSLINEGNFDGLTRFRDESNKNGLRLVFSCSSKADLGKILTDLFAKTDLETTFSFNQVALVNGEPKLLNLKDCISIYMEHNIDCLVREFNHLLSEATNRKEMLDGLLIALEDIENVISLIKGSNNRVEAANSLKEKYKLSDVQVKAILDMKLVKLAHMEKIEIENEIKDIVNKIDYYNNILSNRANQVVAIMERLKKLVDEFGDDRRTTITQLKPEKKGAAAPLKEESKYCVYVTHDNKLGRMRKIDKNDKLKKMVAPSTHTLGVFTDTGKFHKIPLAKVTTDNEVEIMKLARFRPNEHIVGFFDMDDFEDTDFAVMFSYAGWVKKIPVKELRRTKEIDGGVVAMVLEPGDYVVSSTPAHPEDEALVFSIDGKMNRFLLSTIKESRRNSMGYALGLRGNDDKLKAGFVIPPNGENRKVIFITKDGQGLAMPPTEAKVSKYLNIGVIYPVLLADYIVVVEDSDRVVAVGADDKTFFLKIDELPIHTRAARKGKRLTTKKNIKDVIKVVDNNKKI